MKPGLEAVFFSSRTETLFELCYRCELVFKQVFFIFGFFVFVLKEQTMCFGLKIHKQMLPVDFRYLFFLVCLFYCLLSIYVLMSHLMVTFPLS
jgi:hypothetical protein